MPCRFRRIAVPSSTGNRKIDLAMAGLYDRFDDRFYQSHVNAWAIDPGRQTRKVLYNLYRLLNLIGDGSSGQAQRVVARLAANFPENP